VAKPDGFYTDENGVRRPITPKKGGALAAAAALVGGIAFATGGFGSGTAVDSVAQGGLRAKTNSSKSEASKGRYDQAWTRMGSKQLQRRAERALKCAADSYGQVQEFFLRTPCRALDRVLLAIGDGKGNTVVVSIAWVQMGSAGAAGQLKQLADTDGTGNVSPLGAAVLNLGDVRFTGEHYDSDRRGPLTVIAEAAPGSGHPDGETMDAATEIAVVFPPP
jgi:hypothetical protein